MDTVTRTTDKLRNLTLRFHVTIRFEYDSALA